MKRNNLIRKNIFSLYEIATLPPVARNDTKRMGLAHCARNDTKRTGLARCARNDTKRMGLARCAHNDKSMIRETITYYFLKGMGMKPSALELNARCSRIELDEFFAFFEGEEEGTKDRRKEDHADENKEKRKNSD